MALLLLCFLLALSLLWVDALQFPLRTYSVFRHNQHGAMKEPFSWLSRTLPTYRIGSSFK